jgi:hypothetical protein
LKKLPRKRKFHRVVGVLPPPPPEGPADPADAEDGGSHGAPRQWWELQCPAGGGPHEEIEGFIRMKASTYSYSDVSLDADDWLRVIETKLDLTVYTNEECVAITAHQLEGSAKSWWDNYAGSHLNPTFINCLGFCEAFRKQYVPSELMVQKTQEFCTMTQGTMRVEENDRHFMKMMRYAPEDTNPDQKKQFWFLRGLHHGLRQGLKASEHNSLNHLVIHAITFKDERRGREDHMKDMKRIGDLDHFDRSSQRPRDGPNNMTRGNFRSGINQHRSNFGGGNNYYSGGGSFNY